MLRDRIEYRWIAAFQRVFELCQVEAGEAVTILSETQSRHVNVELSRLALEALGANVFVLEIPTPAQQAPVPVRSTGATQVLNGQDAALEAIKAAGMVVDLTLEGLLHAPQLPQILGAKTRVMMVSNEHPEALERLVPDEADEAVARAAIKQCRDANSMHIDSNSMRIRFTLMRIPCKLMRIRCKLMRIQCKLMQSRCKLMQIRCKLIRIQCKLIPIQCKLMRIRCNLM